MWQSWATGALRTSPVLSLYAEANKISLDRRRFSLNAEQPSVVRHSAQEAVKGTRYQRTFQNKPSLIPPFVMRNKNWAHSIGIDCNLSVASVPKTVAPWHYNCTDCDFSLTKFNKDTPKEVVRQEFF